MHKGISGRGLSAENLFSEYGHFGACMYIYCIGFLWRFVYSPFRSLLCYATVCGVKCSGRFRRRRRLGRDSDEKSPGDAISVCWRCRTTHGKCAASWDPSDRPSHRRVAYADGTRSPRSDGRRRVGGGHVEPVRRSALERREERGLPAPEHRRPAVVEHVRPVPVRRVRYPVRRHQVLHARPVLGLFQPLLGPVVRRHHVQLDDGHDCEENPVPGRPILYVYAYARISTGARKLAGPWKDD